MGVNLAAPVVQLQVPFAMKVAPLRAGQAAALALELPAAELVEKLVAEAQSALPRSK
jgi:hypothetical protein